MQNTVHWLGVGLSATPGIKYLHDSGVTLKVWNRRPEKAALLLENADLSMSIAKLEWRDLQRDVQAGDVVVSMLPATMHIDVAQLCLKNKAHFVSSSYVSPEMGRLNDEAKLSGLCMVNEVGLDPGIDHLFAHLLLDRYRCSAQFNENNSLYFRSYCGGFPKVANDFKYKFSWSPLGVLKALKSPARWLESGNEKTSSGPWEALKSIVPLGTTETFEAYPNRDSVPFIKQYGFDSKWSIKEFVRGTLRLDGWAKAWAHLFEEVKTLNGEEGLQRLEQISQQLEQDYAYQKGEPDRVVLSVELEAKDENDTVWRQGYLIDSIGNQKGQAMARLVSFPVAFAVEAVLQGDIQVGVSTAPSDPKLIALWLQKLEQQGETIHTY